MVQIYEETEVIDIVLDVVKWVDQYDEQFDLAKSEQHVLPWSVEAKAAKVCDEYGRNQSNSKMQGNLSSEGFHIESGLDQQTVVEVLQYMEDHDLSEDEVIAAMKMRTKSNGKGGRPSKVDKWEEKIRDGDATLIEAEDHMSEPTWYKLRERFD